MLPCKGAEEAQEGCGDVHKRLLMAGRDQDEQRLSVTHTENRIGTKENVTNHTTEQTMIDYIKHSPARNSWQGG